MREEREGGFRSLSDIPTFKICQIIFLSEELSSKYISISFDVFKYTGLNLQHKYIRLSTRDWYLCIYVYVYKRRHTRLRSISR